MLLTSTNHPQFSIILHERGKDLPRRVKAQLIQVIRNKAHLQPDTRADAFGQRLIRYYRTAMLISLIIQG